MRLGRHMHELWGQKWGLAIAIAIALVVAGRIHGFGLFPPSLERSGGSGRAITHLLVDTPRSTTVDLRQSTYDIEELTKRSLLVGNSVASVGVRERIAARAGVPVSELSIDTPLTTEYFESGRAGATGGAEPTLPYRLEIQANPTVPMIDVSSEAPTGAEAVRLANAADGGLRAYLDAIASADAAPPGSRIDLVELGTAQPLAVSRGAGALMTLLVFALVFAAAAATVLFVTGVRGSGRGGAGRLDADPAPAP